MRTAAALPSSPPQKKGRSLTVEQVHYLVFEGGGGKGFAYLGALQILEQLKILQYTQDQRLLRPENGGKIRGVGGASAGAITALLVSMGYSSTELQNFLEHADFDSFFDKPVPRTRPAVGGSKVVTKPSTPLASGDPTRVEKILRATLDLAPVELLIAEIVRAIVSIAGAQEQVERRRNKPPLSRILQYWKDQITYLPRDMGLFTAEPARRLFDQLISKRIGPALLGSRGGPVLPRNVTFEDHWRIFGIKLLVTASNLSTGKTVIFSKDDTPRFPVADAIRMSMSIPLLFKPYIIEKSYHPGPPCGLYVDGGVLNNVPFREFDADQEQSPSRPPSTIAVASQPQDRRQTLGLRLEIEPSAEIRHFGHLLGRWAYQGLAGTGESQVLSKYLDQMILLDTRGLDLVDFKPQQAELDRAIRRARRKTRCYFGLNPATEDVDPDDDKETEQLEREAAACRG
jgi:NTE family protein